MEYTELVSSIVAAERQAQAIAREAKERRGTLEDDLARETQRLRDSYQERARRRVELVARQEEELAREAVLQLDEQSEQAMERVEAAYAANRDRWADVLFHQIVGDNP